MYIYMYIYIYVYMYMYIYIYIYIYILGFRHVLALQSLVVVKKRGFLASPTGLLQLVEVNLIPPQSLTRSS